MYVYVHICIQTIVQYKNKLHMTVSLTIFLTSESIETLQKWVVELFSEVQEGGHGRLKFHYEGRIWQPHRFYLCAAGQEQSLASVTWPLPCLESAYLKKPQDYIGHLIGHGNPNLAYHS